MKNVLKKYAALAAQIRGLRENLPICTCEPGCQDYSIIGVANVTMRLGNALEFILRDKYLTPQEKKERRDENHFVGSYDAREGWGREILSGSDFYSSYAYRCNNFSVGPGDGYGYDPFSIFYYELDKMDSGPWLVASSFAKRMAEEKWTPEMIRNLWKSNEKKPVLYEDEFEDLYEDEDYGEDEEEETAGDEETFAGGFWLYHVGYADLPKDVLDEVSEIVESRGSYFPKVLEELSDMFGWSYGLSGCGSQQERAFYDLMTDAFNGYWYQNVGAFSSEEMGLYLKKYRQLVSDDDRKVLDDLFWAFSLFEAEDAAEGTVLRREGDNYRTAGWIDEKGRWQQYTATTGEQAYPPAFRCADLMFSECYREAVKAVMEEETAAAGDSPVSGAA